MRYCTHPRCKVLVQSGRCHEHQSQLRQVQTRYAQGNYGRPWRRKREEFLEQSYPWFCALQYDVCTAKGRQMAKEEIEVDHKIPHRGDPVLRDDPTNFQVVCKACHSKKTAAEALQGGSTQAERIVVYGPPGSGKTTWVERRRHPGDLVWDMDAVAATVFQMPSFPRPPYVVAALATLEDALVSWVEVNTHARAFVIVTAGDRAHAIAQRIQGQVIDMRRERTRESTAAAEARGG